MNNFLKIIILSIIAANSFAAVVRKQYSNDKIYLKLEFLSDSLAHLEYGIGNPSTERIYTSPMIFKTKHSGPEALVDYEYELITKKLKLEINQENLCVRYTDIHKNKYLTTICPDSILTEEKIITIDPSMTQNVYGLGENFKKLGSADGDWIAHGTRDSMRLGNGFQTYQKGAVGNVQIPIMYGVGEDITYGLFLDNIYKQDWDFRSNWWKAKLHGDKTRFYFFAGADIKSIRSSYLELTGRPPVLPKKSLGLWMSKFGYHSWSEIDEIKDNLRAKGFPVDGFVLDINWFGGINLDQPEKSRMGFLEWDQSNNDGNDNYFPNPEQKIRELENEHLGLVAIEESYVVSSSKTYDGLFDNGYFSFKRDQNGGCSPDSKREPVWLSSWWGNGGMIDWSNPDAGKWLHDNRRFKNLTKLGVTSHWTDLGEPEMYDINACYVGVEKGKSNHWDIHNIYNLMWNKSIWEGYKRNNKNVNKRPFIMTRSGAAGTQRFGAGMWSADIASNLKSLASHMNVHMHMSLSGIDYFSNDIGGFRKEIMPGNDKSGRYRAYEDEMYTIWFANGAWFDIPVRPHTDNDFTQAFAPSPIIPPYKTAPFLVGKEKSNKDNIKQRYELTPYYYSLAYQAHLKGIPVMPPMVYYYQNDKRFRTVGHQKMIGPNLMVGVVASHGEYKRDIILPKGGWYNYHTNVYFNQKELKDVPTYIGGVFRLPTFAKAGAIIPQMHVDDMTMDVFGHRTDSSTRDELVLKVYEGPKSSFELYEDNGKTLSFNDRGLPKYDTKKTIINQSSNSNSVKLSVSPRTGVKHIKRQTIVKLITKGKDAVSVLFNGRALSKLDTKSDFENSHSGWTKVGPEIWAKSPSMSTRTSKNFVFELKNASTAQTLTSFACKNGWTKSGENIGVVINNMPPVRLDPNVYYEYIWNPSPYEGERPGPKSPVWTKLITINDPSEMITWRCVKLNRAGEIVARSNAKKEKASKLTFQNSL